MSWSDRLAVLGVLVLLLLTGAAISCAPAVIPVRTPTTSVDTLPEGVPIKGVEVTGYEEMCKREKDSTLCRPQNK